MPSNNIAFARNYTSAIDEVYQRASVSGVLNSGRRMVRAGHNAKEILIPKISVAGLRNNTRNAGYKASAELQRTQVAPEADAFTFTQNAGHTGVTVTSEGLSDSAPVQSMRLAP